MELEPVFGVQKRIQRHYSLASISSNPQTLLRSLAERRFSSHIIGLEGFRGLKVLEIGGTDEISMGHFFARTGAKYTNVRLEANPRKTPNTIVGDFMNVKGKFDLIISLGVFEMGAIDINFSSMKAVKSPYSVEDRLKKLHSLAKDWVVMGTISAPCFFDEGSIRKAGFDLISRQSPFYSFMNGEKLYDHYDKSDLLILRKDK